MRWKVQLEGHETGLEELSEAFDQDPRIFGDDGEYYLWSSKFEQLEESGEVKDIGENIVKIVRQLGEFDSLRVEELYVSCVIEIQEDESERKIVNASAAVTATATTSVRVSVDGEEPPPRAESTYEYTQLALKDDKVQELMELRGNGDHWANLYRMYEYIQDNIESQDNIVEHGSWSASEKDLFKHTANSPEAIGHEARHGAGGPAPSDPMDHAKAKALIDSLIENWLRHRKAAIESTEDEN